MEIPENSHIQKIHPECKRYRELLKLCLKTPCCKSCHLQNKNNKDICCITMVLEAKNS